VRNGSLNDAVGWQRSFTKRGEARVSCRRWARRFASSKRDSTFGFWPARRSVSPTEAGERLLRTLGPRFEEIDAVHS